MDHLPDEMVVQSMVMLDWESLVTITTASKYLRTLSLQHVQSLEWSSFKSIKQNNPKRIIPNTRQAMKWFITNIPYLSRLQSIIYRVESKPFPHFFYIFLDYLVKMHRMHNMVNMHKMANMHKMVNMHKMANIPKESLSSSLTQYIPPFQLTQIILSYNGDHEGLSLLLEGHHRTLQTFEFSTRCIETLQRLCPCSSSILFPHLDKLSINIIKVYVPEDYIFSLSEILDNLFTSFARSGTLRHFNFVTKHQKSVVEAVSILQQYGVNLKSLFLGGVEEDDSRLTRIPFPQLETFIVIGYDDYEEDISIYPTQNTEFISHFMVPTLKKCTLEILSTPLFRHITSTCHGLTHLELGSECFNYLPPICPTDFYNFITKTRIPFLETLIVPFSVFCFPETFPPITRTSIQYVKSVRIFDSVFIPHDIPSMKQLGHLLTEWKVESLKWDVHYRTDDEFGVDQDMVAEERVWRVGQKEMGTMQGMMTFPFVSMLHISTPLSLTQWTCLTSKFRPVNPGRLLREWEVWINFQEVWVLIPFMEEWHHSLEHFTIYYVRNFDSNGHSEFTDTTIFNIYISRLCTFLDCFLSSSKTFPRLQTLRIVMNACNSNTHETIASFPGYEDWEKKIKLQCPKLRQLEIGWVNL